MDQNVNIKKNESIYFLNFVPFAIAEIESISWHKFCCRPCLKLSVLSYQKHMIIMKIWYKKRISVTQIFWYNFISKNAKVYKTVTSKTVVNEFSQRKKLHPRLWSIVSVIISPHDKITPSQLSWDVKGDIYVTQPSFFTSRMHSLC